MMKNLCTLLLLAATLPAAAQQRWYVQASGVAGASNTKFNYTTTTDKSAVFSTGAGIAIGRQFRNVRIEAGLSWLQTGYKYNDLVTEGSGGLPEIVLLDNTYRYQHFMFSLSGIYQMRFTRKWGIAPGLMLGALYNSGLTVQTEGGISQAHRLESEEFEKQYQRAGLMGGAFVRAEYRLTPNVRLGLGPTFRYMLNDFNKTTAGVKGNQVTQHNYFTGAELTVNYAF